MPIYEYECKNCSNRFEKLQPITADPIKICPNCGEEKVRRVIQPVGVIFKGSGWYVTDYARKESKTESKETKETKDSKETTSSNGNKEASSGGKTGEEKAVKKDASSKSSGKKD